jgi:hypothetical protein
VKEDAISRRLKSAESRACASVRGGRTLRSRV